MTTQQQRRIAILEQAHSAHGKVRVFACPYGFEMTDAEIKTWSDLHVKPYTRPEDLIVILKGSNGHTSQSEQIDGNKYEIRTTQSPVVR